MKNENLNKNNYILNGRDFIQTDFSVKKMPSEIKKPVFIWNCILFFTISLQITGWIYALFVVGADRDQGHIYRIMFVHVPIAWCAFFWIFMGAFFSICALLLNKISFDLSAHAAVQMGALFSFLVLITGSIWGRPTWGIWWDWDPRLTSSLGMFVIACSYLVLRHTMLDSNLRIKLSAIVAILCAINVPIVYYSVNLWRSVHQPQSFIKSAENVSADILCVLLANGIFMFLLTVAIYKIKRQSLSAQETLLQARASVL